MISKFCLMSVLLCFGVTQLKATGTIGQSNYIKDLASWENVPGNFSRIPPPGTRRGPGNNSTEKISGGEETMKNEFPWMVNLLIIMNNGEGYFCGGILINPTHVLTAAQCIWPVTSVHSVIVTAGDHILDLTETSEQTRDGRTIIVHGSFSPTTMANDVGLVVLQTAFNLNSFVQYAHLSDPTFAPSEGGRVTIAGWGSSVMNGNIFYNLRKADLFSVSNFDCSRAYQNVRDATITSNMICAGRTSSSGCSGDGGGPLICNTVNEGPVVCGVLSFLVECRSSTYPNVFQRTSSYVPWIKNQGISVYTAGYTAPTTTTTPTRRPSSSVIFRPSVYTIFIFVLSNFILYKANY